MQRDLLGRRLEQVSLTDQHSAEGLQHFHFSPGDLVIGDSAYCCKKALFAQMEAGVHVVVRLHWANTPLQQDATALDLAGWLRDIPDEGKAEAQVVLRLGKRQAPMRLIAVRLSQEI